MSSFNRFKYQNEYIKEKYDRCEFTMPKGRKAALKAFANKHRKDNVSEFINELLDQAGVPMTIEEFENMSK